MKDLVRITVSGPTGSGKSAIATEIVAALRAIGVEAATSLHTTVQSANGALDKMEVLRATPWFHRSAGRGLR